MRWALLSITAVLVVTCGLFAGQFRYSYAVHFDTYDTRIVRMDRFSGEVKVGHANAGVVEWK